MAAIRQHAIRVSVAIFVIQKREPTVVARTKRGRGRPSGPGRPNPRMLCGRNQINR